MFVYEMKYTITILDAKDTTKELSNDDYSSGLFSSLKKVKKDFINIVDEELEWLIFNGKQIQVTLYDDYKDCKVRILTDKEIIWYAGKVEKHIVK